MVKRRPKKRGGAALSKKARRSLKIRVAVLAFVAVAATFAGASYALYSSVSKDLPVIVSLKDYKPPVGTLIFSSDDHVIGRLKADKGVFVPLSQIPDNLKNAVLAVEDARFYRHEGLDFQGILRAAVKNFFSGRLKEGGSTITQQLAKVLFLTPERSFSRKLKEAVLAKNMEKELTKDEILELYLNRIYFGYGAYGVETAARTYFGKHVGDLNLAEAAMLAGLISAPARYSPYNNMELAKVRQEIVLGRMAEEDQVSRARAAEAASRTIILENLQAEEDVAPHFVEQVRIYLEKKYGPEAVYREGLKVRTGLDYYMQRAANAAFERGVRDIDKRQGWRGPLGKKDAASLEKLTEEAPVRVVMLKPGEMLSATVLRVDVEGADVSARGARGRIEASDMRWAMGKDAGGPERLLSPGDVVKVRVKSFDRKTGEARFALEQEPVVQGALVAISPTSGYVRAMVGGYNFTLSEYNRALFAKRQPGSAFKPVVYAAAMDAGYTPASLFDDSPKSYDEDNWTPENYDREYRGPTRLKDALVHSVNIVTVELLHQLGPDNVISLARRLGMEGPFNTDLTLALGSCSATPAELTAAYCAFANSGYSVRPILITRVTGPGGKLLESNWPEMEQVLAPETAYLVTSMLEETVASGTAKHAGSLGRPVAGKTGTTNDYVDAWFVGYTPSLAAGVWIGFDDQNTLGRGETGARAALPVWTDFMARALAGTPAEGFAVPEGIRTVEIDAETGLLATRHSKEVIKESFREDTAPDEYADAPLKDLSWPEKMLPGNLKRWLTGGED